MHLLSKNLSKSARNEMKENFEWSANGRKASKERVTINARSNTAGTAKMPLQVANRVAITVVDHF